MTRAFIIHVTIDDPSPSALATLAEDIDDTLTASGVAVESVAPWTAPAILPEQTTTQTQTT